MKSAIAPSGRSDDGNVLEPDQTDFSGNMECLQLVNLTRISSHTDLKRINETRGNITVEEADLLVNGKNNPLQIYTHHMVTGQNVLQENLEFLSGHVSTHRDPTQP